MFSERYLIFFFELRCFLRYYVILQNTLKEHMILSSRISGLCRFRDLGLKAGLCVLALYVSGCHQPDAPEYFGFKDVKVEAMSGQQTNLSATLKFFNPNRFDLKLKRAEVDVSLNGKPAGHSVLDSTIFIPGRDTFYV